MSQAADDMRQVWQDSFQAQIRHAAYNTAPVEAVVRTVAYHLRAAGGDAAGLHFLDLGCGAGPNMVWLAEKGVTVSGVDIAPAALDLARRNLARHGLQERVGRLVEGSVTDLPFEDASMDGMVEACVFQHLDRANRIAAFREVARVLKPGGVFVGYLLSRSHTTYRMKRAEEDPADPGTLLLEDDRGGDQARFHLTNIGLAHFFAAAEFADLLAGFQVVDPCMTDYDLPRAEAGRRGYDSYRQGMWTLYAVK